MMNEAELKRYIKDHLYNDLRWLLCAATEWKAQSELGDTHKVKQPCFHLQVYTMDCAFLHLRCLYEFFTEPPPPLQKLQHKSSMYKKFKGPLNQRLFHPVDRTLAKEVKNEVTNLANDLLKLWVGLSREPSAGKYREVLNDSLRRAIDDAAKVASQYAEYGFKSPFAQSSDSASSNVPSSR
jgi:hypothetical protein